MRRLAALVLCASAACVTTTPTATSTGAVDTSWLPAAKALTADAALDEAAALLCARDTDAVIDDDVRATSFVWEGRVLGLMADSRAALAQQSDVALTDQGFTHLGVAEQQSQSGRPCVALVASRRLLDVTTTPRAYRQDARADTVLTVQLPTSRDGHVYVLGPDGYVDRLPLDGSGKRQSVKLPFRKEGRHVVEVIIDDVSADGQRRGAPEVALLWPFVRGRQGPEMPVPEVLFPDEGHDDAALTLRAEALVQRLRNESLLEPLRLSPALSELAAARADVVAGKEALTHRLDGKDPKAALAARFGADPRAQFIRLAEVQARGGTLKDAWAALTDSPAHRYELISMGVTHAGVSVRRGTDVLGRPTISLVVLLGRRPPARDPIAMQERLLKEANARRAAQGFEPLTLSDTLESAAKRLSTRMMEVGRVDDTLLGGPVGEVALEADASITKVFPLVARIDDPELLGAFTPLMEIDTSVMGAWCALHPIDGVFYVVVLAGVGP